MHGATTYWLVSMHVYTNCAHHSAMELLVLCRPLSSRFLIGDMTCVCAMARMRCGLTHNSLFDDVSARTV